MKFNCIIVLLIFFSCNAQEKNIDIIIKNNSETVIDSLKISLKHSFTRYNVKLVPDQKLKLSLNYLFKKTSDRSGIFEFRYYQKGQGYMSNFGYFDNDALIKREYSIFIFEEGVSEIDKKTPHTKDNKIPISD